MSKAILIMPEMPDSCEKCRLRVGDNNGASACAATMYIILRKVGEKKPDFCPMRPLPEEKAEKRVGFENDRWDNFMAFGWNQCLRAIEGAENER